MRTRVLVILATAALPTALTGQGEIIPRPCRIERCSPVAWPQQVVRTSSDVRVTLTGQTRGAGGAAAATPRILSYEVEETFTNRGGMLGEADYLFPLPKGAAFQDLKLSINGELVAGETLGAEEARRIYEEIVRQQRDPALVEWMGHGLLRTRIFPIAPGERKKVVVRFQAVAEREGDALRVDYFRGTRHQARWPRVGGEHEPAGSRRDMPDERASLVLTYPETPELGRAYSPTHALDIEERGGRRRIDVRGDAREVTLLIPLRRRNEVAITVLPHRAGRDDGFALITLSPPALSGREMPRDVTLVLDVSGSMSGRKIEQARAAGRQLLATLGTRDRFRLVDFSSAVRSFRDDFAAATHENVRAAERYLDELRAEGATNIEGALEEALAPPREGRSDGGDEGRLSLVLFVTDGEATVGARDARTLAERAARLRRDARLFTFGLGADVNVMLLEQLALDGRGTAHFVRPDESTERAVEIVATRLTSPLATGLRVLADGIRLLQMHPAGGVDLFAGQDLVLFARYEGSGPARIAFEGASVAGPVRWSASADFPERERDNAFVPRLWATQRVGWLSAERRRNGASPELDAEIRELGQRYGIPTELTSYFVREPGMVVAGAPGAGIGQARRRLSEVDVTGRADGSQAAERERRFEAGRDAAAKRTATSLAAVDSIAAGAQQARGADAAGTRTVAGRTFTLRDQVWIDAAFREGMRTVKIKAYSTAYFALAERLPGVREAFAIGERVIVAGQGVAFEVGDVGAERLDESDLRRIDAEW
ncbi:MAG: VIT and VWA domain-containing protein [Gemmatimonadota bacterium]|nr:VIT and VWA domain-containing protein [Gemmatimonadota bacterium]